MNFEEELLDDDSMLDRGNIEWIKESTEILDDVTYNVYHAVGENSLIKLHINDEVLFEL